MTNINRDPLLRAIYDAAQAIEACGASEALTAAVMAVTAIYQHAERVLDERDAALARIEATDLQLSFVLHELAGAASLCWEPRPTGVFDSGAALAHVERAINELRAMLRGVAARKKDGER